MLSNARKLLVWMPLALIVAATAACSNENTATQPEASSDAVAESESPDAAASSEVAVADWEPQKPVEFIIMAGQGGGADRMARLLQSVVEQNDLASQPLIPINKAGGSGAEALEYMNSKEGDDHTILVTLNSFYTTPIRQPALDIDVLGFTPIARMAEDTFLLWVHADSGITNFDEFLAAAEAAGSEWVMAGTGKGQEDEILTNFLNDNYGLEITYVPFSGGGDVAKALAGQQVSSTVNNPSEALGFYEDGSFVPIVAFTSERLEQFPDTPTLQEQGEDFAYFMQRSVVGTPGMSPEAAVYYQDLFSQVYEMPEWQEYLTERSLQGEFMTGDEMSQYWQEQYASHEELLEDVEASAE